MGERENGQEDKTKQKQQESHTAKVSKKQHNAQTDRPTDRPTDRQTDRQTGALTDSHLHLPVAGNLGHTTELHQRMEQEWSLGLVHSINVLEGGV